jgi:hypothetical protein
VAATRGMGPGGPVSSLSIAFLGDGLPWGKACRRDSAPIHGLPLGGCSPRTGKSKALNVPNELSQRCRFSE